MVTTLCLFTCALATAQAGSDTEWLLVPRLSRGQELVYSGSFTEEFVAKGVQCHASYGLENRVFVLETQAQGVDVALFTVLKFQETRARVAGEATAGPQPWSVRLELAHVDLQGKVTAAAGAPLPVPLEGPATVECGVFVEMPHSRAGPGKSWDVAEDDRPPRTWRAAGTEAVNGTRCLKLVGVQQSPDWDRGRADQTAWRRQDTVWLTPGTGIACRVERIVEQREPARQEATQRSVTRYDLKESLVYPGQLCEDRSREIKQARTFMEMAEPLLREPGRYEPRHYEALLARIAFHLDNRPATPYREAVRQVQRRLDAVRRGEPAPASLPDPPAPSASVAAQGQPAPDFVAPDLQGREPARLNRLRGRPVLLIFFSPKSLRAEQVLRFGQAVAETYGARVAVLGLAMSDDTESVRKLWDEQRLTYPPLSGQGLRLTFDVSSTPKFIVLDGDGVVRSSYVGWGVEIPHGITEELRHWLRP
ncbi:MAG TPA: redoxin domain-containing protein [Gemmataceae bacterium]|jgi:peroxiredoxin|nr:redoxin domain-containing protein [Gemmataceae bacterium]